MTTDTVVVRGVRLSDMQVKTAQYIICSWFVLIALLVDFGHLLAADVSLSWQPSSSTNVTGYNIYYGTVSGIYTGKIMFGNVTTISISNLDCGTTYYWFLDVCNW